MPPKSAPGWIRRQVSEVPVRKRNSSASAPVNTATDTRIDTSPSPSRYQPEAVLQPSSEKIQPSAQGGDADGRAEHQRDPEQQRRHEVARFQQHVRAVVEGQAEDVAHCAAGEGHEPDRGPDRGEHRDDTGDGQHARRSGRDIGDLLGREHPALTLRRMSPGMYESMIAMRPCTAAEAPPSHRPTPANAT